MTIKLIPINVNNWDDALDLKISDDHEKFVTSNVYSIAQAQFYPHAKACGIYNDDEMVGFTMYGIFDNEEEENDDEPDHRFWISRMMIAEDQRRKGFGRAALKLIIDEAKKQKQRELVLSTEPENIKAIALYESMGFHATGIIEEDEEVYILTL